MAEDDHSFKYDESDEKGPGHWGDLKPAWQTCKTGKFQSPIDLKTNNGVAVAEADSRVSLEGLKRSYKEAPAVMMNRGHDIVVQWEGDAGGIVVNGTHYKLVQCHWHSPSEHTINGQRLKMELHMVHNSSEGQLAVVAVLYEFGHPDKFLSKVFNLIELLLYMNKNENEKGIELGNVNPWTVQLGSRKYFRYMGSLTVPPCTEGVVWTIVDKIRTVSREQSRALALSVHHGFENNSRPTQQIDGRSVQLYRPQCMMMSCCVSGGGGGNGVGSGKSDKGGGDCGGGGEGRAVGLRGVVVATAVDDKEEDGGSDGGGNGDLEMEKQ
ncbi:alpha carbonic anhydrase 4-like [Andrographis paniculata]|uniref:alpha carbonic anhydrase 4-like n=1 Tax=Andrographis paniculata TaxID=175694 RepID=UPI0021E8F31F|nr:alpha carbonic anhydrase 4-like [Andrographis paniculata]